MPWSARWHQGWQSSKQGWRSQRPWKEGGGQQHRPYRVCDCCGAWIFQNRIGANPICKCGQPWIPMRDEVGDGLLWPMPDKIPRFGPEATVPTAAADQWKFKTSCNFTGMLYPKHCERQLSPVWSQWKLTRRMTPKPSRLGTKRNRQSCGPWVRESSSWKPERRSCSSSSRRFNRRSARYKRRLEQPKKKWKNLQHLCRQGPQAESLGTGGTPSSRCGAVPIGSIPSLVGRAGRQSHG